PRLEDRRLEPDGGFLPRKDERQHVLLQILIILDALRVWHRAGPFSDTQLAEIPTFKKRFSILLPLREQ
ncbi:MAG: hypothetical protein SPL80_05795, partial [Bacilli bacterium]|nr:hypothetical protein [Bacilli bacterium]